MKKMNKIKKRQKKKFLVFTAVVFAVIVMTFGLFIACSQPEERLALVNVFLDKDNEPPVLLKVSSVASSIVKIDFNEPVKVYGNSFGTFVARADGKSVYVTLNSSLPAGQEATLEGRVQDYYGNSTGFEVGVWGYNPNVPNLVINEFTTKRDTRNPDKTELYALTGGSLAGVTLYCGTPDDYDAMYIFPDITVSSKAYIVLWWVKEDFSLEDVKGDGLNFASFTRKNPSDNNGTLTLANSPSPGATILDAVIYSDFGESMDGFGTSKARDRALWVINGGFWKGYAIDSSTSTATRSMARKITGVNIVTEDTNTCNDWYITCSGGATFGSANTSEPYKSY